MKINYKIKEVLPNIFAVIVKNHYDLAMLFCRAQEYYESPNSKFRNNQFSIWNYMKWYHEKYNKGFTYGNDWSGFNIPIAVLKQCYKISKIESPYDIAMKEIVKKISSNNGYVIGCEDLEGDTFKHEICHALYYTNKIYKKELDNITKTLPKKHYKILKENILQMGYASKVVNDEIQAYLQFGYEQIGKKINITIRKKYNKNYKEIAKKIKIIL
jgi:hypothetical protein